LIGYDDEFIDRITVYSGKEEKSDVDEREEARYGATVHNEEIKVKYDLMMDVYRRCIERCEEIVFSDQNFIVPEELCH
jgi:hypothetical protein